MGSSHSKTRHWTEQSDDEEDDTLRSQSQGTYIPEPPPQPLKPKSRPFSLASISSRRRQQRQQDAADISTPASPAISPPLSSTFSSFQPSKRTSRSSIFPSPGIKTSTGINITAAGRSPPLTNTSYYSPSYPSPPYNAPVAFNSPTHSSTAYTSPTQPHRPPPISPRSINSTNQPLSSPALASTRIFRLDPSPTGGTVYAWPSSGGVLIATCTTCELTHLAIGEHSERFLNPAEEDAFCQRFRGLGAKRFPNVETYRQNVYRYADGVEESVVKVGYPENGFGVWVVKLGSDQERSARQHVEYLRTVAELRMAKTMRERCDVIARLGGRFYANPRECEDIN